jgi:ubiquinone/menaquinone biosynthesis C-methylase UbiE
MNDEIYFQNTEQGYDSVAVEYARQFFDELEHKPLDRDLLQRMAREVGALGAICDMGCGPGQVARYLKDHSAEVVGLDLSEGMLVEARRLNPDIPFLAGNMLSLSVPDSSWVGIAAFYSIIHIPRPQLPDAIQEFFRVLRPGGMLMLAFHAGDETLHLDSWWEKPVSLDFNFLLPAEIRRQVEQSGFNIEDVIIRAPYSSEHLSQRAYIIARKPTLE